MARYVTFGEIMLRLKPVGAQRLFQSPTLEATFGGGEANVAVALARVRVPGFLRVRHPAKRRWRRLRGENCTPWRGRVSGGPREGSRLGIYFLEAGADHPVGDRVAPGRPLPRAQDLLREQDGPRGRRPLADHRHDRRAAGGPASARPDTHRRGGQLRGRNRPGGGASLASSPPTATRRRR